MSVAYKSVQWNAHKKIYDLCVASFVMLYLATFILIGKLAHRHDHAISDPILLMRALGTCAILLLHVVLCIGPLARLDRRFPPLLYNRRHLGVATFTLGFLHAFLAIGFYHGFGRISPLVSIFISSTQYGSIAAFPFEMLGLIGLLILFLMAATSHDFWLKNLSPRWWKSLHMLVYVAWATLILHVALGAVQSEKSPAYTVVLALGVLIVPTLHLLAGRRENPAPRAPSGGSWQDVASFDEIPESRAKVVTLADGCRVAIFKHEGALSALSNVCAHQGGPIGEGKIVGGCVTCPWHGYQYLPHNGQSPPPFTERIGTYRLKLESGRVLIDPSPLPPGTPVQPVRAEQMEAEYV